MKNKEKITFRLFLSDNNDLIPKIIKLNEVVIHQNSLKIIKSLNTKPKKHNNYNEMYFSSIGLKLAFKINATENKINFLRSIEIPFFKKSTDATKNLYKENPYPYKTSLLSESFNKTSNINLYSL